MAAPIIIVPGKNVVLQYVARQMSNVSDVLVLGSANLALWQSQQTPPRIVVADAQLDDMSGAELAEILPNFAPQTRIFICGQPVPSVVAQVQAVGAEFVALDRSAADNVAAVYRALDVAPPSELPGTAELNLPSPTPERRAAPQPLQQTPAAARSLQPAPAAVAVPPAQPTPVPPPVQPVSPAPAPANQSFNGAASLVIQPQQFQTLTRLLDMLGKEVGAQAVVLIDSAGMVLVQSGTLASVVMELVGPLLATSFSATGQLARHLQEQHTNAAYIHESDRYDIYAFNISYRVSLIIMFDKKINPGKLGTVWVYAKRAMRQLQQIIKL
jgi:DNA-binding NarL/FixJ family response regulator/predicted regulator of Ras-like GTPase activity (Roadblock/LC7/MglB family)